MKKVNLQLIFWLNSRFVLLLFAVPEVDEHERVTCEYIAEKRQRLEDLDNTFGTTVLPTLEKVLYKVKLKSKREFKHSILTHTSKGKKQL